MWIAPGAAWVFQPARQPCVGQDKFGKCVVCASGRHVQIHSWNGALARTTNVYVMSTCSSGSVVDIAIRDAGRGLACASVRPRLLERRCTGWMPVALHVAHPDAGCGLAGTTAWYTPRPPDSIVARGGCGKGISAVCMSLQHADQPIHMFRRVQAALRIVCRCLAAVACV